MPPSSAEPAPHLPALVSPCPIGYTKHRDSCYLFSLATATYADADSACQFLGATLAAIGDEAENQFLTDHLVEAQGGSDDFWIAFHRVGELGWRAGGGQPSIQQFAHWAGPEPTIAELGCAALGAQGWTGFSCEVSNRFICERA